MLRTPLVCPCLPSKNIIPGRSTANAMIDLSRTSRLRRTQRAGCLPVPRHPALRRSEQWHPQHDRRDPPLDQRQDGNFQGGVIQSHQAGHQEGPPALRTQLLPPPRIYLELRCFPSGQLTRSPLPRLPRLPSPLRGSYHTETVKIADLGGS